MKTFAKLLFAIFLSSFFLLNPKLVTAATITTLGYTPSGSVVGTSFPSSTTLATFTPITAVTSGSTITLTLPVDTTITSANIIATDFTISQSTQGLCVVGGVATAPSSVSVNTLNRTITLTVANGSLSVTVALLSCGTGPITIRTSALAGG